MSGQEAESLVLVVDLANVVGSRPDGWWRDRAAAAERWLAGLAGLQGRRITAPSGSAVAVRSVVAVLEGRAREAEVPEGVRVVLAAGSGDDAVVAAAEEVLAAGEGVLVVTADRGLRARLAPQAHIAGPRWLTQLID